MDGLNKSMYDIGSDSAFAILARSQELEKKKKKEILLSILALVNQIFLLHKML